MVLGEQLARNVRPERGGPIERLPFYLDRGTIRPSRHDHDRDLAR